MNLRFRVMVGIVVNSADKTNAEIEVSKLIKSKKISGEVFSVEEA
jgi:hypothetical protein